MLPFLPPPVQENGRGLSPFPIFAQENKAFSRDYAVAGFTAFVKEVAHLGAEIYFVILQKFDRLSAWQRVGEIDKTAYQGVKCADLFHPRDGKRVDFFYQSRAKGVIAFYPTC